MLVWLKGENMLKAVVKMVSSKWTGQRRIKSTQRV